MTDRLAAARVANQLDIARNATDEALCALKRSISRFETSFRNDPKAALGRVQALQECSKLLLAVTALDGMGGILTEFSADFAAGRFVDLEEKDRANALEEVYDAARAYGSMIRDTPESDLAGRALFRAVQDVRDLDEDDEDNRDAGDSDYEVEEDEILPEVEIVFNATGKRSELYTGTYPSAVAALEALKANPATPWLRNYYFREVEPTPAPQFEVFVPKDNKRSGILSGTYPTALDAHAAIVTHEFTKHHQGIYTVRAVQ